MFNRTVVRTVLAVAAVGVLLTASTSAFPNAGRATHFTFSASVQLPGVVLPPGAYTFELANANSLNLVRVTSRDRSKVYLTAFTTFVERPAASNLDPAIVFGESSRSAPPPIAVWYPFGDRLGRKFIY